MRKIQSTILSTVGIAVLLGGIAAGVVLTQKAQFFREKAAGSVSLSIQPSTQNVRSGNTVALNVIMDTDIKSITGFDIKLNYNPDMLEVISLEKGTGVASFTSPVYADKIDNTSGLIEYGYFTLAAGAVQGTAIDVLKINAKIKASAQPGTYDVNFLPTTILASLQDTGNVLQTVNPAHLTINKQGDINGDNLVNLLDINEIIKDYGHTPPGNPANDLDGNNIINLLDINVVIRNYGN